MRCMVLCSMLAVLLTACKSEYTKMVEAGLASGQAVDTLIFDMPIGLAKKEFYATCWELNRQRLISQGSGNSMAKYAHKIVNSEGDSSLVYMLFYGIFDKDDKMRGMDMEYKYSAWSPWIEWAQPDFLTTDLVAFYEHHYPGNSFINIPMPEPVGEAYVKIDGAREILIYPSGDQEVVVKIQDLKYKLQK